MTRVGVDVVVVSYRPGDALRRCLDSVLASGQLDLRVLLVNNDPDDPLPGQLAAAQPNIRVIHAKRNVGFCAAVNQALRMSEPHHRYVLLLNPDAWVDPDYVRTLVDHLE